MDKNTPYSIKQSIIFSQKVAQLSKALWKSTEKDWQNWIKPFDLNINEHHILLIAYQLEGASISDIAKFGVMHVSTAFNFSKKLEERGLLTFCKKQNDKRNTYVNLTNAGEKLLLDTLEVFDPQQTGIYEGSLPIKELYGKFPEFSEVMTIVRHIYGSDFMLIFEKTLEKMEQEFIEEDGKLIARSNAKAETS